MSEPVDLSRARAFVDQLALDFDADPARPALKRQGAQTFRIDWFRLLQQLNEQGYSLYDIAHFTAIPKSTLIGYKQGAQPLYHTGVRLLTFWSQAGGKDVAEAPTISLYSFMA